MIISELGWVYKDSGSWHHHRLQYPELWSSVPPQQSCNLEGNLIWYQDLCICIFFYVLWLKVNTDPVGLVVAHVRRLYIIIQPGDWYCEPLFSLRRRVCSRIWAVCGALNRSWKTLASRASRWAAERTKQSIWRDVCSLTYYRYAHLNSHIVASYWFMTAHAVAHQVFLCCRCCWGIINCALIH